MIPSANRLSIWTRLAAGFGAVTLALSPALAQVPPAPTTGPVPPPAAVETSPLPPPGAAAPTPPTTAAPASPAAPPAPPAPAAPPATAAPALPPPSNPPTPLVTPEPRAAVPAAPPAQPGTTRVPAVESAPGLPTLAPGVTEANSSDEVELVAKKAATLRGKATWDAGYAKISEALMKIRAELLRAGIKPAGKSLALFLSSDDESFEFEAMVPIEADAQPKTPLGSEVKIGQTPTGKAFRFGHKGAYDSIDDTYEVLTAYLDAKGIEAKEQFIEEYLTEDLAALDENFALHVYVQPK
ncbi:MAG: GyrI-like domain-containing protein [Beijerinckiaceae bacterium]